jgi:O-succinylbenzoic acid--CoA ligase
VLEAAEAVVLLGVGSRPVRLAPRQRPPERATAGDPDIALVQTSGTTGAPKLVRLTAGVCTASARACLDALGRVGAAERWLLPLSPHRVGGLAVFWRSAVSGCAVVHLPRFEERSVTAALGRGPTLASMVPVMLHRLLDAGAGAELARLRAILVGGAPSSREEVAVWLDHGLRVCPSYGLTETGSQIAVVPPGRVRELAGSAGLVHPGVVVDIAPARDGDGEILVGGPLLTPGYTEQRWNDAAFTGAGAERRLHTGDLGRLREGVLTVAGRRDRLIVTGGEKVRPEDVEAVLLAHPQVRDAGVWGTPDPRYGSIVHAVVSADADAATLEAWCRRRLAPHQVPRRFSLVAAVPRSADGKLAVRPPEL